MHIYIQVYLAVKFIKLSVISIWLMYHTADCVCGVLICYRRRGLAYLIPQSGLVLARHCCTCHSPVHCDLVNLCLIIQPILKDSVSDTIARAGHDDHAIYLIIKRVRRSRHNSCRPRKPCGAQVCYLQEPLTYHCQSLVSLYHWADFYQIHIFLCPPYTRSYTY